MKGMRILVALCVLALTACGDGSVQGPDFTRELLTLSVAEKGTNATTLTKPAGRTITLEAVGTYSVAIGNEPTGLEVVSAKWTSSNPEVVSIDSASGVGKALKAGTAELKGSNDGLEDTVQVTVTPAVIDRIDIVPAADEANTAITTDTIASGGQKNYRSVATLSDGTRPNAPSNWISSNAAVATPTVPPPNPTSTKTIAVPSTVLAGETATITATLATDSEIKATLVINVVTSTVQSLTQVTLNPASPVAAGLTTQATAVGLNADGSTLNIGNDSINWSSSDTTVATVDATGRVTTIKVGNADIIATLKDGTYPDITDTTKRTAKTPLAVTDPACTTPLRSPQVTAVQSTAMLCVGCSITNPNFAIDANDTNHADFSIPVGLLGGSVSLTIQQVAPVTNIAPGFTGFIVGRPAGDLVSAELLSQVVLSTIDSSGTVLETFNNSPAGPLVVDLLGTSVIGGINDRALIRAQTTKPFTGLVLTYSSGVLTALGSLQVYNACGTVTAP